MHGAFFQIANVGVCISDSGYRILLYHKTDAENTHSDSRRRRFIIRQWVQEALNDTKDAGLYQTAYTGDMLSKSRCSSLFIRQRIQETFFQTADQETLYDTADSGLSLFDSGCRWHSFRGLYQIVDA